MAWIWSLAESVIATMRDTGAAKSDNAKVGNSALSHDICLPVLASEHGLRCGLLCIHCGLQIVYVLTYHMFTFQKCTCYKIVPCASCIPYSGNLSRKKTLQILRFCVYLQKFFPRKLWRRGIFLRNNWAIHGHHTSGTHNGQSTLGVTSEVSDWLNI